MTRALPALALLLACAEAEPCPGPHCEDVQARKLAVLTACGLPASTAAIDCTDTNLRRLDCQVSCMEAVECSVLDGSDGGVLFGGTPYYACLAACPGLATP